MSLSFKTKYDEMKNSNPANNQDGNVNDFYSGESSVRNICFVQQNGDMIFLNYSYLVSGEYKAVDNSITLVFTAATIILKGINLEGLFYQLLQQLPKHITAIDKRYNATEDKDKPVVNEIHVEKN